MFRILCLAAILALVQSATRQGQWNRYHAYRRPNIRQGTPVLPTLASIQASGLSPSLLTVFVVHGHEGSAFTSLNPLVREEILHFEDVNVIVVDWSVFANIGYDTATGAVPSVGMFMGEFIQVMLAAGFQANNIHLIGFDLGAHVVGFAGRHLNGQIGKITGLNPRGQLWGIGTPRLSRNDAQSVEVIHTNAFYGIDMAMGHMDFFINNGLVQPGCPTHRCSHDRAFEIMAASIGSRINGNQCATIAQVRGNTCRGQLVPAGTLDVYKRGNGLYRANTRFLYFPFV